MRISACIRYRLHVSVIRSFEAKLMEFLRHTCDIRYEMENVVFWDMTLCSFHINSVRCSVLRLLVTTNVVPRSSILVTLVMEAICSSETSVLRRAIRRHIPEDGILRSHRRENLQSYIALTGRALLRRRSMFPVRYELGFYVPEDGILHSHRRENLKSYITLTGWAL
jgi:hypothetical protein